jgi:hypothetical protein
MFEWTTRQSLPSALQPVLSPPTASNPPVAICHLDTILSTESQMPLLTLADCHNPQKLSRGETNHGSIRFHLVSSCLFASPSAFLTTSPSKREAFTFNFSLVFVRRIQVQ